MEGLRRLAPLSRLVPTLVTQVEQCRREVEQGRRDVSGLTLAGEVFPPTLVKEDEALPETEDCRMDLRVVLRWGHDEPVVFCIPVLR